MTSIRLVSGSLNLNNSAWLRSLGRYSLQVNPTQAEGIVQPVTSRKADGKGCLRDELISRKWMMLMVSL